jgi:MFS family permease
MVLFAVSLFSFSLMLFGVAGSFAPGVIALALCGVSFLACSASLNTSVQLLVAEHIRGRVLALYAMSFTLAFPVGALIQTALADRIGPRTTIIGAGALLGVVAVALAVRPAWLASLEEHSHREIRVGHGHDDVDEVEVLEPLVPVASVPPVP